MKKLTFEEMKKLFGESVATAFNDKYKDFDSVDRTQISNILLSEGVVAFYYTASLKFIEQYLTKVTEK